MGRTTSETGAGEVVLTSVPEGERELVARHLPGAVALDVPFTAAVAAAHPRAETLVVGVHDRIEPRDLDPFHDLKGVITRSTGWDHLAALVERPGGPACFHLDDYCAPSVAEHTLLLLLALKRRLPEARERTLGEEPSWCRDDLLSAPLHGCTVAVWGTGRIGARVCRLLLAHDAHVRACDLVPDPALSALGVAFADDLPALVRGADGLAVCVPLTEVTRGAVDASVVAGLAPGAVVVNTARGAVVDEDAVQAALASGVLAGFGADVLVGEPAPALDRWRGRPGVLLTPHVAAYDVAAVDARYGVTAEVVRGLQTEAVDPRFRCA